MKFQATGYTIKQVQQQIHVAMEDALRPLGLNISQYNVLKNLEALKSATGAELARRAFITPQTMHTILTTMERKGLIVRDAMANNSKSFLVSGTAKGDATMQEADDALNTFFKKANSALTNKEYTELDRLLNKLSTGLDNASY